MQVLDGASAGLVDALCERLSVLKLSAGDVVVEYLERSGDFFFILDGEMRVSMVADSGRLLTYEVLRAGDMFGEVAALDGLPRTASVAAETEALVARLDGTALAGLIEAYTEFAMILLRRLARLNRHLTTRLMEYHAYDVKARVCAELIRLNRRYDGEAFRITDQDMASRIGSTRENVSRIHGELRKLGLVERQRSNMQVVNEPMISAFIADHEFT